MNKHAATSASCMPRPIYPLNEEGTIERGMPRHTLTAILTLWPHIAQERLERLLVCTRVEPLLKQPLPHS